MKTIQQREWRSAFDDLLATLRGEQKFRNERGEWIDGELQWMRLEREAMVDRVNVLRARRGATPVALDAVCAKEQLASGHIDYTTKFALGCADLVVAS